MKIREKLQEPGPVWAVGVYDVLSALIAQKSGFDTVMTGGFGVTASLLGLPDLELLTMTENVGVVANVSRLRGLSVIADIDTGYGSIPGVLRAVEAFRSAGAQAIIIEDQVSPKSCSACVDGTDLIPLDEATAKIRAACDVAGEDVVVIARTDAFEPQEAFVRGRAYVAAGARLIQPVSKTFDSFAGLRELRDRCGAPLSLQLFGWLERDLRRDQIAEIAGIATFTFIPLLTAAAALSDNIRALHKTKSGRVLPLPAMALDAFSAMIGFDDLRAAHGKYSN